MTPSRHRLRWATDIHLDHLRVPAVIAFADDLFAGLTSDDAVVITGDISSALPLTNHLRLLDEASARAHTNGVPWQFVLGNHDYYDGSIADVRDAVRDFDRRCENGSWLGGKLYRYVADDAVLVGVDGWADARTGNPMTPVLMNDFQAIDELADEMEPGSVLNWRRGASRDRLHAKLRELADREAMTLHGQLRSALDPDVGARRVVIATHLPPWSSAAWHEGRTSSRDWCTYFVSSAVGTAIEDVARRRPDVKFAVLCGHTHGCGVVDVLPNLRCRTGGADYGRPEVQATFDLDTPDAGGLFS